MLEYVKPCKLQWHNKEIIILKLFRAVVTLNNHFDSSSLPRSLNYNCMNLVSGYVYCSIDITTPEDYSDLFKAKFRSLCFYSS